MTTYFLLLEFTLIHLCTETINYYLFYTQQMSKTCLDPTKLFIIFKKLKKLDLQDVIH